MAWHDNNWNGKICISPAENSYCTGTHSLLSARIQREKKTDLEAQNPQAKIDSLENYTPPCYWSCNAFSEKAYKVKIKHPFENIEVDPVEDTLQPFSVYTWPFRLSFNHSMEKRKTDGNYPPKLKERVEKFFAKFIKKEALIFFYANYDNPISADERKYVLLGCSLLTGVDEILEYNIDEEKLKKMRSGNGMKNLTPTVWAVQLHHDFENWGILLPYKDYLDRIKQHPEEEQKLKEMRVLIDEESLIPSFKYVAEELDEDKCLYLLYKIKKSLKIIEDHGIVNVDREKRIIEKLIQRSWERRGLYPSLPRILDIIAEDESIGDKIVSELKKNLKKKYRNDPNPLDFIFDLIMNNRDVPDFLGKYISEIETLRSNIKGLDTDLLKKLSLFELTSHQLKRIIYQNNNPFKKDISNEKIIQNPYLLVENYVPEEQDLDSPELLDEEISIFKIDIGMFPDRKYLSETNSSLQNLANRSPERLRAIIVDFLKKIGEEGDCYANLEEVYNAILTYPLFYKEELELDKKLLFSETGEYHNHFEERLTIKRVNNQYFFYLNEVYQGEQLIKDTVLKLLERSDWSFDASWVDKYVEDEAESLEKKIPSFEKDLFRRERKKLLTDIFRKSLYIISGKPGSGKTFALKKIIEELQKLGENTILLAPTGKAALRLKEQTNHTNVQTIDMFLYTNGYSDYLDDFENTLLKTPIKKQKIDNLIIDETSMVDLQRLTILFSALDLDGHNKIKRIILVGDEKQLPPIGLGKPFVDIIDFIKSNEKYEENYIRLKTNCRQEYDKKILELAEIFGDRSRYYEEILGTISKGGEISLGLTVELWENSEQLYNKIDESLKKLILKETQSEPETESWQKMAEYVNFLFGLYSNGYVKNNDIKTLALDNLQLLSPYRAGYFGTIGLNEAFKSKYRERHWMDDLYFKSSLFDHADKIIRINNWYTREGGIKLLKLSNGSIGVINNKSQKRYRKYYFTDQEKPLEYIDNDENFELAYAITIHKSQGSDFKNIFLIIPKKATLLSRELLYTALTRSRYRVFLFLEKDENNPLEIARNRSFVLSRNTSVFIEPEDYKKIYHPDKDVHVRSKAEYIIYSTLKSEGLKPEYEKEMKIEERGYNIHPDFTIEYNEKVYYWEHLGQLDIENYLQDWNKRKKDYIAAGAYENLITTDDLRGIDKEILLKIIQDIKNNKLQTSTDEKFSKHHYKLYKA